MTDYDVVVVGARCAGSPTAMLLARAGYQVLLLDRAAFPSDTLSTHLVLQPGVAALARWGLLDQVRDSGCPPLTRVSYTVGDLRIEGGPHEMGGHQEMYSPRRYIIDDLLVRAAISAGAEFRDGTRVTGLLRDESGRVTGVEGVGTDGRRFRATARLVVGADGMRSTVAGLAGAAYVRRDTKRTCAYYSYWTGLPTSLELHERPGSWVAAVATHHGRTLVLTYFPQSRFGEVRADAERAHLDLVRATAPELAERMRAAEQAERLRGTGDQQNYFRTATGPGWVLVGDSAHHKDSITARGISDAFAQADLLARHMGGRLAEDPGSLDAALRAYASEIRGRLVPGYETTLAVAALAPPSPQRLAVLRAVQRDRDLTSTYFDTVTGDATATALFTPRLQELLAAS